MSYRALASDYDGTLARDGAVDTETMAALIRFRQSGRRLIMVTGRELRDLESVFPRLDLFDRVVAENGALLYTPAAKKKKLLAPPVSPSFMATLKARGVRPLSAGEAIVATWRPNEKIVAEVIRDLGLDLRVILNKGSVMVLPAGVYKTSGLEVALDDLRISAQELAGVGDAENDLPFLAMCGLSAAVSNALPEVKQAADVVLSSDHGHGVAELIDMILTEESKSRPRPEPLSRLV
ncbi:MAG: HAD family hydrolase [Bryobacteraceae bacterium]